MQRGLRVKRILNRAGAGAGAKKFAARFAASELLVINVLVLLGRRCGVEGKRLGQKGTERSLVGEAGIEAEPTTPDHQR